MPFKRKSVWTIWLIAALLHTPPLIAPPQEASEAEKAHEHQHTFKCDNKQAKAPVGFVEWASPTPSHMSEGYREDAGVPDTIFMSCEKKCWLLIS